MAVQSITLTGAREKVKLRTGQKNSPKYSDTDINDFINQAQTLIATHTDCLRTTVDITLVASQAGYSLPDDWFRTLRARYEGSSQNKNLIPGSIDEYLGLSTISTTTIPDNFVIDDFDNKILIYPTPSASGDNVRHDYIMQPALLSDDADVLLNDDKRLYRYHNDVVDLTVNLILALEKGALPDEAMAPFIPRFRAVRVETGETVHARPRQHKVFSSIYREPRPRLPPNYPCNR